jgi:hypothetical protein
VIREVAVAIQEDPDLKVKKKKKQKKQKNKKNQKN